MLQLKSNIIAIQFFCVLTVCYKIVKVRILKTKFLILILFL